MSTLNYHHLHYFWAVATDGNLTRTAQRLRVAPSALSTQIRQLEEQLGEPLFTREGRRLVPTEAGRMALAYADDIFAAGRELVATLQDGRRRLHPLRVGAVATLSRNFQRSFVQPLLAVAHTRLHLVSGSFDELLDQLAEHALDVVLANRPASRSPERRFRSRLLARQPVSIVSSSASMDFRFPEGLEDRPMILPGATTDLRAEFDALCSRLGVRVRVIAEVDDMAMLRLLARDSDALVLVPTVVVRDELRQRIVRELCVVPDLAESFYAVTVDRRFQHPLLRSVLALDEAQLLGGAIGDAAGTADGPTASDARASAPATTQPPASLPSTPTETPSAKTAKTSAKGRGKQARR